MTHMMTPPRGVGRATVCQTAERQSHRAPVAQLVRAWYL